MKSLSAAQIRDIFTGKITSWKDVGGNDLPIVVVAEAPGLGTRTNVEASFPNGQADHVHGSARCRHWCRSFRSPPNCPTPSATAISPGITGNVAVIPDVQVEQTLGLATKARTPSADEQKLAAAVAEIRRRDEVTAGESQFVFNVFSKLRISTKLTGTVVASLIGLCVMGMIAVFAARTIQSLGRDLYTGSKPPLRP